MNINVISKHRNEMMGFAALWIYFFHEWKNIFESFRICRLIQRVITCIGFCGVDIFLILSGIGLVFSIRKNSTWVFYKNRFKRLFLPYLIMNVLYAIALHRGFKEALYYFSGLRFLVENVYGMLWYLQFILFVYLLFPLYWKVFKKASNKMLFTIGCIGIWFVIALIFKDGSRQDAYIAINRIPVFFVGVLWGDKLQSDEDAKCSHSTYFFFGSMLFVGMYLEYLFNFKDVSPISWPLSNVLYCIFIAVGLCGLLPNLLEWLEHRKLRIHKAVKGVLKFFGMISLEFYCVQEMIGAIFTMGVFTENTSPHILNVTIFSVSVIAAFALYKLNVIVMKNFRMLN